MRVIWNSKLSQSIILFAKLLTCTCMCLCVCMCERAHELIYFNIPSFKRRFIITFNNNNICIVKFVTNVPTNRLIGKWTRRGEFSGCTLCWPNAIRLLIYFSEELLRGKRDFNRIGVFKLNFWDEYKLVFLVSASFEPKWIRKKGNLVRKRFLQLEKVAIEFIKQRRRQYSVNDTPGAFLIYVKSQVDKDSKCH